MKLIKKILLIVLIGISITSCSPKENYEDYEDYNFVILRINMPLNINDLENLFEIPLQEILEKDYIGEITGDNYHLNSEKFPCATDIEFEIRETKMEDFKNLIKKYKLPKNSYLTYNKKEKDLKGVLDGIELKINNLESEKIETIYKEIQVTLKEEYTYISNYNNNENLIEKIYIYTENINNLITKIEQYIKNNSLENNIKINELNNYCDN